MPEGWPACPFGVTLENLPERVVVEAIPCTTCGKPETAPKDGLEALRRVQKVLGGI